ncbi:MAG: hypothetical protein ACI3XF_04750 [Eubacteriales bacterium]
MKKKIKEMTKGRMKEQLKSRSKSVTVVYIVLCILVLFALVRSIMLGNFENAFICVLVLFLFFLPSIVEKKFHIDLPDTLEIIILVFIFASEILGELQGYFIHYSNWDTLLHTTWGFLCAALGFSLVDIINRNSKIKFYLSPVFVAIVAFCFSMTVGVFWEFFEFGMDRFFAKDMQKDTIIVNFYSTLLDPTKQNIPYPVTGITETYVNGELLVSGGYLDIGLYDTMEDLFVNFIGAAIFSVIGYFYIKKRGDGKIARQFIPTLADNASKEKAAQTDGTEKAQAEETDDAPAPADALPENGEPVSEDGGNKKNRKSKTDKG